MTSRRRTAILAISGALALILAACSGSPALPPPTATDASPVVSTAPSSVTSPSSHAVAASTPRAIADFEADAPQVMQAPPTTATTVARVTTATTPARWKPRVGSSWQWQLSGRLNLNVSAHVYDVDLFDTSAAQVKALHAKGRKVICYFSAGSYEAGRPDSRLFPASVKGRKMLGWPEYWLDIRDPRVLKIMAQRMDLCKKKGFDGVEPDNVDGYQNLSGFRLTASNQLTYNKQLARLAHNRGLAVGLKNDLDQVRTLQPWFDFAINEECYAWDECTMLKPFISAGKPVFHVEYEVPRARFCPTTTRLKFSSMLKNWDLDAARYPCPR